MAASLLTPLHLAASLLALFAAAGLAIIVLTRPGRPTAGSGGRGPATLAAVGAVAIAVSHGLSGALVTGLGDTVAWLRAAGLVLVAVGLSTRDVARLSSPAVLIPVAPLPAAVVSAVAGGLAGLRALVGGRRTALVGLALLAWGAAEWVAHTSATAASWLVLAGSLALGAWVWQASARRLQAKFVTAFVGSLLVVVVLMAGTLSGLGSADLVAEELRRLEGSAERLAQEIARWPEDAVSAGGPFAAAGEGFLRIGPEDENLLAVAYNAFFSTQDFFVLLGPRGEKLSAYSPTEDLAVDSFVLGVAGTPTVERVLGGEAAAGDLITVAGQIVAVGAVRLEDTPEEVLGVLLTGRVADDVWVESAAVPDVHVIVETGENFTAASEGVESASPRIVAQLADGATRQALTADGRVWYAAAQPIRDPGGDPVGRVVAVSTSDVIAQLEHDMAQRLFLLALLGALFAGAVAALVTRRLVAPIRRLTTAAAAVREGDLEAEAAIDSPDEVGELGRTFNEMTVSLAAQSAQLREAATVQSRLRARMEALTASMGDALVAVDADGRIITFNPAAERLVGRAVDDVLGLPLEEVLRGRGPGDTAATAALGAPDSEEAVAVQLLLEREGREPVPTAATAAPVRDPDGQVLGRVLVLRDVTREAEIERMKTEFLANVSHELRTPLTPIKGYADVLARRDVGLDATRRFAEQILASSARLERIVQMVVDFAALDSGRLRLKREPVALSDLVGEALDEWRARHPERDFHRWVARALPPVLVDAGMLRRCLDELLDNAVKFSPGGEPVTVTAKLDTDLPTPMVRLSVRDRGVGIEPKTAARIFSDFYQVDASETRHYGGLGLGLALVRRIVDGLGGDASVESQADCGSTVNLLLPVADHSAAKEEEVDDKASEPARGAG
ncbi:MAG TPA: ATP-binding protein [Egibacteraceae bacterium]|nr:ATP-binding protein [Egibacteraceae bacterium]